MKKLFFCAAVLLAAISFAACSDDDETNLPATPDNIAGTWQIVHSQGWEIYDGEKESWSNNYPDADGWYRTYSFDNTNTCITTEYENDKVVYTDNDIYWILDNEIYINNVSYEIKSLTQSQLVLFCSGPAEGGIWRSFETYKRIK